MKFKLISIALVASATSSHALILQIAGMDSNAGNPTAAAAAGVFDTVAPSQPGGSTTLSLDGLSATNFSGASVNLGNGFSVDASASTSASLQSGSFSANVSGISFSSTTGSGDLIFNFATPTTHFGFYNEDFNTVASGLNMTFDEGQGNETVNIDTALGGNDGEGFFGVVFDNPISTLTFSGTGGDVYRFDQIRLTPVPEPSAFALITGLIGCGMVFLKRRCKD